MILKNYIFFDLGWTLEDESKTQVCRAEDAALVAAEFGIATSAQRILELQEAGAAEYAPSVFRYALRHIGLNGEQTATVDQRVLWDKSQLYLYAVSREVLEKYYGKCFLGIVANQSPGTLQRLHAYGISEFFGLVLASAELGLSKPDPAIFALALKKAGCRPDQAWMVGDRLDNDIRPANMAGWRTIRILNGYNTHQQPRDELEVPDYTISELSEITRIIPAI